MSIVCYKRYKDKIVFAADTQLTDGFYKQNIKGKKLWQNEKCIVCSVGTMGVISVIRKNFDEFGSIAEIVKEFSLGEDMKGQVIYIFEKATELVTMYSGSEERLLENDFYTDGSGKEYALAILDLGKSPEEAVRMACKYDLYCSITDEVHTEEYKFIK